jgi:hypothetical protein
VIAAFVALAGAAVAFAAGLLSASPGERRWWRLAAALVAAVVAFGGWRVLRAGDGVALQAHDAAGQAAQTIVVVQPPDAPREVRRVSLRRPVPAAPFALGAMALGGVLALGALAAGRKGTRWAGVLPAAGAAATLALLLSASGSGAGEAGVRSALGALDLSRASAHVESFTVPEGSWSYATPVTWAVAVALLAALAALWGADDRPALVAARPGVGIGAAIAAVGPAVQMSLAGGLLWRPLEGVLWAAALLTAGAALEGASAARRASLAGVGLAVAALGLAVAA